MNARPESSRRRALRGAGVPWLAYVGVSVVAPAANGAWRHEGFAEHALVTLVVSGAMVAAWLALARWAEHRSGV